MTKKPIISRAQDRIAYAPPERWPKAAALLASLRDTPVNTLAAASGLLSNFPKRDSEAPKILRLLRLAEYLLMLPDDYEEFDMGTYSRSGEYKGRKPVKCGSAACALGHAPYAVGLPRGVAWGRAEGWPHYSDRVFGDLNSLAYAYLFGGTWEDVDNTPHGAAARILRLVEQAVQLVGTECASSQLKQWLHDIGGNYGEANKAERRVYRRALLKRAEPEPSDVAALALRLEPDPNLYLALEKQS